MCTFEKRGNLFCLTLTGKKVDDEHYLNPTLITPIQSAISDAKNQSVRGSVWITLAKGKFFSNGLANPSTFTSPSKAHDIITHGLKTFKALIADFISLPMPTIAIVTGHAAGAGMAFALSHDYVFMRRDRGILYMSEIDVGFPVPDFGFELIKSKVGDPNYRRDILLRGVKVKADEGVKMGIVDKAYDSRESAVEGGIRMGDELSKRKWDGEVYVEMRKSLYPELCKTLGLMSSKLVVNPRL